MKEMTDVELREVIDGVYPLFGIAFFFFSVPYFFTYTPLSHLPTTDPRSSRQKKAAAKAILKNLSPAAPNKKAAKHLRAQELVVKKKKRRTKVEMARDAKIRDEELRKKDERRVAQVKARLAAVEQEAGAKEKNRLWSAAIYRGLDAALELHIPEGSYRDADWERVAADMTQLGRQRHEEDGEPLREFTPKMCYDQYCRVSKADFF